MDPISLSAGVIALITPYLLKSAESFAGEAGKWAWGVAEKVLGRVKAAARAANAEPGPLAAYEQDPAAHSDAAVQVVADLLRSDPELMAFVTGELKSLRQKGPTVRVVQEVDEAIRVTGLQVRLISPGREVDVEQTVRSATDVTGIVADEI